MLKKKSTNVYEYLGTCIVAIVMLEFFNLEDLPGQPPQRLRFLRDTTTFSDIRVAGRCVDHCCLELGRPRSPGWNNAGKPTQENMRFLVMDTR